MPAKKTNTNDILINENKDFDEKIYRNTLGLFSTGVTIVTTMDENLQPIGITVNSFASVSLKPALILWSIDKSQPSYNSFLNSKGFAVSVLNKEQIDLCYKFSSPSKDKFKDTEWTLSKNGFPIISNSLAWFDCLSWTNYPGGDHQILLGEVNSFDKNDKEPLIFWNGKLN